MHFGRWKKKTKKTDAPWEKLFFSVHCENLAASLPVTSSCCYTDTYVLIKKVTSTLNTHKDLVTCNRKDLPGCHSNVSCGFQGSLPRGTNCDQMCPLRRTSPCFIFRCATAVVTTDPLVSLDDELLAAERRYSRQAVWLQRRPAASFELLHHFKDCDLRLKPTV